MTLNTAWLLGDHAFLVADTSATTKDLAPRLATTSLGQPQRHPDGWAVEEVAGKLVPFGSYAAGALCGDSRGALAFARFVRRRIECDRITLDDAVLAAGHSLMHEVPPFRPFIVTLVAWDGLPQLKQYDSTTGRLTVVDTDVVVEGSLRRSRVDDVMAHIRGLPGPAIHSQVVLSAALACLAGMASSEDLVADFVAGAFHGLTVGPEGVVWQPNLLYIFYQNDGNSFDDIPMQIVSTRLLDGVHVIGSSLSDAVTCLVTPGQAVDRASWMRRNGDQLGTVAALQRSRLVAFVRAAGASIVIIDNDGRHFGWTYENGLRLRLSPELTDRLRWKPKSPGDQNLSLGLLKG